MDAHLTLPREPSPADGLPALAAALRRMRVRTGRRAGPAMLPGRAGRGLVLAALLLALVAAGVWGALQHQLVRTRAALDAAELRLALTESRRAEAERHGRQDALRLRASLAKLEARQQALGDALAERFRTELAAVLTAARAELEAGTEQEASAVVDARLAALERALGGQLAGEVRALRAALAARGAPEPDAFKQVFAAARGAVLFIRSTYSVRMVQSGEIREQTAFGTGFLISPAGVALTAQHVIYPWRFNERLLATFALGLAELVPGSLELDVWLADRRVTSGDEEDAAVFAEEAYRLDAAHAGVRILHVGRMDVRDLAVVSPLGPTTVHVPRVGAGDLVVLQLVDPGRRFPYLRLDAAPAPAPLDEVLVVGYPLSRLQAGRAVPQAAKGRVRRAGGTVLELDTALHPGNSGGPILDARGRVVGMASAILDTPVYGIALHAAELRAAWAAVRADVRAEQRGLRRLGCDPGALDGIPGPHTLAARACAERLAGGL